MSIRRRGPNSWQVRVYVGDRPNHATPYEYRPVKGDEADALRAESELKAEFGVLPNFEEQRNLTVQEYGELWFTTYIRRRAPKTASSYRGVLNRHIYPLLGRLKIRHVTSLHIQRFINQLQCAEGPNEATLAPGTIRYIYAVLRSMILNAHSNNAIKYNPFGKIALPQEIKRKVRALTPEEADSIVNIGLKRASVYSLICVCSLLTGMRMGEVLQLSWDNVDLANKTVYVVAGGSRPNTPKTEHSRRKIIIPDQLVGVLAKLRVSSGGKGYVFATKRGTPVASVGRVGNELRSIMKEAGVDIPDFTFHDLRHAHASILSKMGVPLVVISNRLGHARLMTTANIYLQDDDTGDASAASALSQMCNKLSKTPEKQTAF